MGKVDVSDHSLMCHSQFLRVRFLQGFHYKNCLSGSHALASVVGSSKSGVLEVCRDFEHLDRFNRATSNSELNKTLCRILALRK